MKKGYLVKIKPSGELGVVTDWHDRPKGHVNGPPRCSVKMLKSMKEHWFLMNDLEVLSESGRLSD